MKIKSSSEKISVFIYKNIDVDINDYVKKLVLKLKKKYKLDIFGFYTVNVYLNNKFGAIIDIVKEEDIDFFVDLLDLKVNVFKDSPIYLKFDDYFILSRDDVCFYNNNYYILIDKLTYNEFIKVSEFCDFIYGSEFENIKSNLLLNK